MALYPPIVASSMPAFDIKNEEVKIYFSLSDYNNYLIDNIQSVETTVRRQSSNINVIKGNNGIISESFNKNNYDPETGLYFVTITTGSIKDGFQADVIYKVQLRFRGSSTGNMSIEQYSQWSTVCIIKPINAPKFYINEFYVKGDENSIGIINTFSYELADFTGVYEQSVASEKLKSWRLRLYNRQTGEELANSDWNLVSTYNYNEDNNNNIVFECSLAAKLQNQGKYKLKLDIETKNGYTKTKV